MMFLQTMTQIINDDIVTKIIEALIGGVILLLAYIFRTSLLKLEKAQENFLKEQQKFNERLNIAEQEIKIKSSRDDDFKRLLDEKFKNFGETLAALSVQINILINRPK